MEKKYDSDGKNMCLPIIITTIIATNDLFFVVLLRVIKKVNYDMANMLYLGLPKLHVRFTSTP